VFQLVLCDSLQETVDWSDRLKTGCGLFIRGGAFPNGVVMEARGCIHKILGFDSSVRFLGNIIPASGVYKAHLGTVRNRYLPGIYVDEWDRPFANLKGSIISIVEKGMMVSPGCVNTDTEDVLRRIR
jgi:hypothetical protein